jgi:DNA-binding transcriptional MerR regulator
MDDDDEGLPLTIGQLASRTGLAVRTIRYWSDIGAVPPAGRSSGGHRLYDADSIARLELVRTLRQLGLGLEVRRVLAREVTVADVATAHVAALDAQIRSLRLTRAVLSAVARRHPGTEEMTLMNKLARLSAAERRQIIDDFIAEVFTGLDAGPKLKEKLQLTAPELPEEPAPEQVSAWVELTELVQDPVFRQRMRTMAEYHAAGRAPGAAARDTAMLQGFTEKMSALVDQARQRGIAPDSPEAAQILGRLLEGADSARRAYVRKRLEAGVGSRGDPQRNPAGPRRGRRGAPQPGTRGGGHGGARAHVAVARRALDTAR